MRSIARIIWRLARYLTIGTLGFVVGALALYIYWVRSGPPLELWHTETLTEEFTVERAKEIASFQGYLQLEDRLFAQLEEKIYVRTDTGPEFVLARYSTGSAADPHHRKPNWNRSFELSADTPVGGVLLLHGMSDSPYSLRALAEALHQRGYWVIGLRLPGHGTIPSGLKTVTWEDMAAAVRLSMAHLASKVGQSPIHIMGYSTGAPLALDYSLNVLEGAVAPPPASLVLISPAIGITPAAVLAEWQVRLSALPGLEKLAWTQILPEFDPFKYNSFTSNAGTQVHLLTRYVAQRVETLAVKGPIENFPPTLVFLSTVDATVSTDAVVDNLLEHLAPGGHELVLFDINRNKVNSSILVSDPGPLTTRMLDNDSLPFALTLISNKDNKTTTVVGRRKPALSAKTATEALNAAWPRGVISLSHVALPIPPDDPLYGQRTSPYADATLQLGQIDVQGERGLLKFPADWLLRLRYNPFYDFLESRATQWVNSAGNRTDAGSESR